MSEALKNLEFQYKELERLSEQQVPLLVKLVEDAVRKADLTMTFPVQHRIKTWESISAKFTGSEEIPESLSAFTDLIGLRVIVHYPHDVERIADALALKFGFHKRVNRANVLSEKEFGYTSLHLIAQPHDPLNVNDDAGTCLTPVLEIQIRTLAQHIWADTSHQFQYKKESEVPVVLRRSINRLAAVLELVDGELERFCDGRERLQVQSTQLNSDMLLNTDLIEAVCDLNLPSRNKSTSERYAELIPELNRCDVKTTGQLDFLLKKHRQQLEAYDTKTAENICKLGGESYERTRFRVDQGFAFTHNGLVRTALKWENPEKMKAIKRETELPGILKALDLLSHNS